ncbi:MAG: hypothetical protein HC896_13825 [Bacteroidales bacterium]|nr:hypothetical protein [Bacteroidales bacterium]
MVGLLFSGTGLLLGQSSYQPNFTDPLLEAWRWKSYAELEGASTTCMLEANDNTIWFGTETGLIHYDGVNWASFTPKNNVYGEHFTSMCEDKDGVIYAGSYNGLSKYTNNTWQKVFPFVDANWPIYNLAVGRDGDIWAGTPFGALRMHNNTFLLYTTKQMAQGISHLKNKLVIVYVPGAAGWQYNFGETGSGIYAINKRTVMYVAPNSPAERAGVLSGDYISDIKGCPNVHALGELKGLKEVETAITIKRGNNSAPPEEYKLKNEKITASFGAFPVHHIHPDRDGNIWFGLWEGNIVKYTPGKDNLETGPGSAMASNGAAWELIASTGYMPRTYHASDGSVWIISMKTKTPVIQIKRRKKTLSPTI